MVQPATRDRIDAFWSATLGVEVAQMHAPGVRVYPNPPDRVDWRGLYVLAFDDAANIFAPKDLYDDILSLARELDVSACLMPPTWQRILGRSLQAAYGPVLHYYLDSAETVATHATGRRIGPHDTAALETLRAAVSTEEWLLAGFTGQPAMLFGLFADGEMVAAANLTSGPDAATDIGVVIHAGARNKGYATAMVATAAKQALALHGVARLRALAASASNRAVAAKLGFTEYGRNLAAYLLP